ncbi:hypothetical protein CspHIS471_0500020 [Cutaneotrichosporon sp. HIS471]|nr:hypothetical protein CspHIS471_0500020 [Cutaneotrichosporon sp. HIS471]
MSTHEYAPFVFPRDTWPTKSYFPPRGLARATTETRIRFAAQQASRKLARALKHEDEPVDGADFDMGVVDVVLQLLDQDRTRCFNAQTTLTDTVAAWHLWLSETSAEVAEIGKEAMEQAPPGSAQLANTVLAPDGIQRRSGLVLSCINQLWRIRDTRESYNPPPMTPAARAVLARYGPGAIEKSLVRPTVVMDVHGGLLRTVYIGWDGREVDSNDPRVHAFMGDTASITSSPELGTSSTSDESVMSNSTSGSPKSDKSDKGRSTDTAAIADPDARSDSATPELDADIKSSALPHGLHLHPPTHPPARAVAGQVLRLEHRDVTREGK